MPDHDPADRRRRYELNSLSLPPKLARDRFTKRSRLVRKLKHERTLEIDRAMQAARKLEMTFKQRPGRLEFVDYLFSVHRKHE
jgi:hypothetical protein